eukprot:4811894-Pleurochrysis_carterae.AAC.1
MCSQKRSACDCLMHCETRHSSPPDTLSFIVNQVAEEKMTAGEQADLDALLDSTLAHVLATDQTFAAEKLEADRLLSHWRLYVD